MSKWPYSCGRMILVKMEYEYHGMQDDFIWHMEKHLLFSLLCIYWIMG